jgi:hypothetical protein
MELAVIVVMLLAGALHLVALPERWRSGKQHGILFAFLAALQMGYAIWFYENPSRNAVSAGIALNGALILLWGITRVGPPKWIGAGKEPMNLFSWVCKAAELLAMILLLWRAQ